MLVNRHRALSPVALLAAAGLALALAPAANAQIVIHTGPNGNNSLAAHAAGYTGTGATIGIIDKYNHELSALNNQP